MQPDLVLSGVMSRCLLQSETNISSADWGAPQRLAPQRAVKVVLGEVRAAGRAAVAARERAQRLQAPRDGRRKAPLAAHVGHHQLVQRRAHLHCTSAGF